MANSNKNQDKLKKLLKKYNINHKLEIIEFDNIDNVIKERINQGFDGIVAAGGDGTVNAIANSLAETNIPMGIIPLGTFNHFAKDNGIPLLLESSIKNLSEGEIQSIDLAKVNDRYFVNNSSLGIYTRIVRVRELYEKSGFSKIRAIFKTFTNLIFKVWFNLPRYHFFIKTDDIEKEVISPFIFIGNNEYIIDQVFRFGRRSNMNEGVISLYYLDCGDNDRLTDAIWKAYSDNPDTQEEFRFSKYKWIQVKTSQKVNNVSVDGEIIKMQPKLDYKIIPQGLKIIKPTNNG